MTRFTGTVVVDVEFVGGDDAIYRQNYTRHLQETLREAVAALALRSMQASTVVRVDVEARA